MTEAVPATALCTDCGLEVPIRDNGAPRPHVRLAVKAGHKDAACVTRENEKHQRGRENRKDRNRWARELAEKREAAADFDSRLPKHLQVDP